MQRLADLLSLQRWWVYYLAIASVGLVGNATRIVSPWDGVFDHNGEPLCSDFSTFYTAGHMVREGDDALIYDRLASFRTQSELLGRDPSAMDEGGLFFLSPPTFLPLIAPFVRVPYVVAAGLWALLSLVLLAASARLIARDLLVEIRARRLLLLACLFIPTQISLQLGQTTALTLSISTFAFLALRRRQDFLAGLLVGCLILKPQLGLGFAIVFLGGRRWASVAGTLVGMSAWLVASWLVAPGAWRPFLESIPATSDYVRGLHGEFASHLSTSVLGALDLLLQPLSTVLPLALAALFTLGLVVWTGSRWARAPWEPGSRRWDLSCASTLALAWLCSPHLLIYDVALFLLPASIAARWIWQPKRPFGGGPFSAMTFVCIAVASLWNVLFMGHAHAFLVEHRLPVILPQLVTFALVMWSAWLWREAVVDAPPAGGLGGVLLEV